MKGVKAIYETLLAGPVKVRALAIYSRVDGQIMEVICRVTGRHNRIWPTGYLTVAAQMFLWNKHRYTGRLKCNHLWIGRPDLSGLPEADDELISQLS